MMHHSPRLVPPAGAMVLSSTLVHASTSRSGTGESDVIYHQELALRGSLKISSGNPSLLDQIRSDRLMR